MCAKAEDQESPGEEEDCRGGKGGLHVEGAPEGALQQAGDEIADSVDGGEGAEGHTVLF